MAFRQTRLARPLFYATAAVAAGSGALYYTYRPREIPGSDLPAVPLTFARNGSVAPPKFPKVKSRAEHITDLKRSSGTQANEEPSEKGILEWLGRDKNTQTERPVEGEAQPYDLLVIGGGATGSGIALDAATRGLKVAVVERDDFSSGTSSKSTKLVHGGVRYLEKAVWELDYNQYGSEISEIIDIVLIMTQVQVSKGGPPGENLFPPYCTSPLGLVANHAPRSEVEASPLLLDGHQSVRLFSRIGRDREFIFSH